MTVPGTSRNSAATQIRSQSGESRPGRTCGRLGRVVTDPERNGPRQSDDWPKICLMSLLKFHSTFHAFDYIFASRNVSLGPTRLSSFLDRNIRSRQRPNLQPTSGMRQGSAKPSLRCKANDASFDASIPATIVCFSSSMARAISDRRSARAAPRRWKEGST
jgi:hypothetical protein